ncbi:MAG: prepilin peptidase [Negativicutes bacterium]|nr:prepilin peptidase [Negativicutes bacterium]
MGMGAIGIGVVLGLFVGHFLAACIYCIPRQQSLWGWRRLCPHCQANVGWQDKIPLLGYMLNRGRCRYCQEAIGVQQVTAELAMAALGGVAVWQGETWLQSGAFMVLAAFLLLISFIDYEWQLIFDKVLVLFAVCGLAISVFGSDSWLQALLAHGLSVLGGGVVMVVIALASRGGMGGGDVKFVMAAGCWLTGAQLFLMLLIAFFAGGLIGGLLLLLGLKGRKDYIPFGPFLALGCLVAYVYGYQLLQWYWQGLF